ncbi:MAG TPA: phenylalanine--tRNA ligase subunit alpha [Candidatus Eremiobacteraceae bacterium]|nr:phenylalanine--tRNA ligase subunit alpha [Candidatus Eremiobacteraceae bacterium]
MDDRLAALEAEVERRAAQVRSGADLESLRTDLLGRKGGKLSTIMSAVGKLPASERAEFGRRANETKARIEARLEAAHSQLADAELDAQLTRRYDITFPGAPARAGSLHILRRTLDDIAAFFRSRGFAIAMGPEVETEYFNFEVMNIPADHPSRDAMDTFYLKSGTLLRTHTSPMQVRAMLEYPPPIAILVPGKTYRRDALDARHAFNFHQFEGLQVDRGITFGHLKGFVSDLCRHLYGKTRRTRFRPSYFQFTEPSAEVDVSCPVCDGNGCRTCGGAGWLEMGGSGMVHPHVLKAAGYDPESYTGWAFGLGIERIAMVRHGIDDIRLFTENDPAFLEQFA